jgi:hypothetical protein
VKHFIPWRKNIMPRFPNGKIRKVFVPKKTAGREELYILLYKKYFVLYMGHGPLL